MYHIYKYELPSLGETCEIETPGKLNICDINWQLSANGQHKIYMWACVDIMSPIVKRTISVVGTGWEIQDPEKKQFLRTVHMPNGCVCHVLAVHNLENELFSENSDSTLTLNAENSAK